MNKSFKLPDDETFSALKWEEETKEILANAFVLGMEGCVGGSLNDPSALCGVIIYAECSDGKRRVVDISAADDPAHVGEITITSAEL